MSMQTRHKNMLFVKFDQLWAEGVVRIDRWEMISIFDKKKITSADWRLLGEHWDDYCGSPSNAFQLAYVPITLGESPLPVGYYIFNAENVEAIK